MQPDRPLAFDMGSALNALKEKLQQKGAAGEKKNRFLFSPNSRVDFLHLP